MKASAAGSPQGCAGPAGAFRASVACRLQKLSLRRLDGRLPGEFAVPPLFMDNGGGVPVGAYVSNLCAAPDYRRRGLGTRLLTNGIQASLFSVLWKVFEDMFAKKGL